jgi:hypothetical protein
VGDEQLQHRHRPGGADDRYRHRLPHAGPLRRHGAVEPVGVADVGEQLRLAGGPRQAGQALAALVVELLAGGVELLEAVATEVPGEAADQHLPGRQPHLPHPATGEVADGLHRPADELEHELEEAALLLGALHLGEVADHRDRQRGPVAAVADQRQVPAAPHQLAGVDPHAAAVHLVAVDPSPKTAARAPRERSRSGGR